MSRLYGILAFLYCAGLFVLSSDSSPPQPSLFPGQDKIAHAVLYAGLAAVVGAGLRKADAMPKLFQSVFPIVFAGIYGLSDETHQLFVPNRSFDLLDLAADIIGAAIFQACRYSFLHRKHTHTAL